MVSVAGRLRGGEKLQSDGCVKLQALELAGGGGLCWGLVALGLDTAISILLWGRILMQ